MDIPQMWSHSPEASPKHGLLIDTQWASQNTSDSHVLPMYLKCNYSLMSYIEFGGCKFKCFLYKHQLKIILFKAIDEI